MRRTRVLLFTLALLAAIPLAAALTAPSLDALTASLGRPSILILDRHGRTLYEAIDAQGNKRVPVPLASIPQACRDATVATEDARFYQHFGVDPFAIARSLVWNAREGRIVSGASTLTQQLARNLLMSEEERSRRTLARKIKEALLAIRLELRYSKADLLSLYLNTTYYGHYATGIEAAAQAYFGAHAAELDLAQCAMIAGLPQWPPGYNPIENPDGAKRRQAVVLRLMVEQRKITQAQADAAAGEALAYASTPFPIEAPHFVMMAQAALETLLPAELLRQGGLRVTTTLDLDWQTAAEDAVRRRLAQLRPCSDIPGGLAGVDCDPDADPNRRVENAALVSLDPGSGAIRALVGSPDYFDPAISGAVNAALSSRQPGSAIKPLTYALALDPAAAAKDGRAAWTAATVVPDIRASFPTAEGAPYTPNNYDRRFHGPVTVRAALANSYNIPAVHALHAVGVSNLIDLARELGIPWERQPATLAPGETPRYGLSLTLGGGEVRLLDLTAAYAAFASGGYKVEPYAIERVETLDGAPVWERAPAAPRRVLDERVAFLITDILSDDLARQPAFGPGSALDIGRPAAAKTGTTTDWRDNWTVGYTPDVVTGVWAGNADNTPMRDVSGVTGAGPSWHDFMVAVTADQPPVTFPVPDGMTQLEVCADSGLPPGPADGAFVPCPNRALEWFIAGTEPSRVDRQHVRGADGRIYWQLGPEYQAWARERGFPQPPQQVASAAGEQPGADARPLRLVSPDPGRVLRIDPGLPRDAQQIPVTALPSVALAGPVTLLVDGQPLAIVDGPEWSAWWPLETGRHTFAARAVGADGTELRAADVVILVE
jgi:membrane peptidoglycan carboxypeptidase